MSFKHAFYVCMFLRGFFCVSIVTRETIITRDHQDIFEIPPEMCWDDIEKQCNSMGGKQRVLDGMNYKVPCTCQCNYNSTNNVFGWFDNQWKCGRKKLDESGCILISIGSKSNGNPMKTVSFQTRGTKLANLTGATDCRLGSSFSYLGCNSVWQNQNSSPFFFQVSTKYDLYVRSKAILDKWNYTAYILGQIIRVEVECSLDRRTYYRYCLFFKVRGEKKCIVDYPRFPTLLPTTAVTTEPPLPTNGTGYSKPTHGDTKPEKQNQSGSTGGIIAGVICGLVVLVLLGILIFLWLKRKRSQNIQNDDKRRLHPKKAARMDAATNAAYEGVIFDDSSQPQDQPYADLEYSYAYTSTHPTVIKDQNRAVLQGLPLHSNDHSRNMKTNSASSPIYNTLEDPDYAKLNTANETSYNVLERSPEAGWRTPSNSDGPVYNTLEDPSYAKLSRNEQESELSYNVLERGPATK